MAVKPSGRATEKQMKYLWYLSRQGKEVYGEDFSIRKLAVDMGFTWPPSYSEARELIDKVLHLLDAEKKEKKPEAPQPPDSQAISNSTNIYMLQLMIPEDKLVALTVVLESMNLDYILFQEVKA